MAKTGKKLIHWRLTLISLKTSNSPFEQFKSLELAGHVHTDVHIPADEPNVVKLNAGTGKVEAWRPEAEGWRVLSRDLATEPNFVVYPHAQLKGELIGTIGDLSATVHANNSEIT